MNITPRCGLGVPCRDIRLSFRLLKLLAPVSCTSRSVLLCK